MARDGSLSPLLHRRDLGKQSLTAAPSWSVNILHQIALGLLVLLKTAIRDLVVSVLIREAWFYN